ncbi:MAG: cupredoxin domain-containing protein [Candidatus Limnocylindrales bacterium]
MILTAGENNPRFVPDTVTAKAGTVVFFLQNVPGANAPDHQMTISPANITFLSDGSTTGQVLAATRAIHPNEKAAFTVAGLTPGSYLFWCSIALPDGGNHAANGMTGTLTITP